MSLSIYLREFGSFLELTGIENQSSVYSENGKDYIQGSFCLRLNFNETSFDSDPLTIGRNKIEVTLRDKKYFLEHTDLLYLFTYTTTISISKNDFSPIAYISSISLHKTPELNVAIDNLSLSIIGKIGINDLEKSRFHFSSLSSPLLMTPIKSPTGRAGFYIKMINGDPCVVCGSPSSIVILNHFGRLNCRIKAGSELIYNFSTMALDFVSGTDLNLIQMTNTTGWQLKQISLGTSFVNVKSLRCIDGWIQSIAFEDVEIEISKIHTDKTVRTGIFASSERLIFNYPMEIPALTKSKKQVIEYNGMQFFDLPHFTYSSSLTEKHTLANQHYGIKIRGLSNEKGSSVKIDSNLAVIRLENTGSISLQAGATVTVRGKIEKSIMLPKIDLSNSGSRIVKIPCVPSVIVVKASLTETEFSSFEINTGENFFKINKPEMEISPFSPGTLKSGTTLQFDKMSWIYDKDDLPFKIGDDGITPNDKENWLSNFRINAATSSFKLLENQNTEILYDQPNRTSSTKETGVTVITSTTETVNQKEKEKLIYLAYAGAISYVAGAFFCKNIYPGEIYSCLEREGKEFLNVNFDVRNSTPDEIQKWLKNSGVNELIISYYNNPSGLKKFIDDNIELKEPTEKQPLSIAVWSVYSILAIPLIRKAHGKTEEYCYEIIDNEFNNSIICGLAIDQSTTGSIDFIKDFGFTEASFKAMATAPEYRTLFPSYNKEEAGGKIDPTNPKFSGVVLRNMPLIAKVPTDKIPILKKLLDQVNKNLILEFGWRDDKGFTWISKFHSTDPSYNGIDIVNNSIVKLKILKVETIGHQDKLLKFSFKDLFIGLIKTGTDGSPDEYKFSISADAYATFNDEGLDNFKIVPKENFKNKVYNVDDIIPGFDFMKILDFETNFKQLYASVELFPDKKLAEALPIFEKYVSNDSTFKPEYVLKTVLAFDIETGSAVISIFLDSTKNTKIFGKWPLAIKAINIFINSPNGNRVEIVGEFNIGLKNFAKVGGRVIISHKNNGWDFDMELDQIGGNLSISDDLKIEGFFKWGTTYPPSYISDPSKLPREPLGSNDLSKGKERPFLGILKFKASDVFGEFEIFAKLGSKDGIPYTVFGFRWDGNGKSEINLGIGRLSDPEFLILKNADTSQKDVENIVLKGAFSGIEKLRNPQGDLDKRIKWLDGFKYSDKTDMTLVASGKLAYGVVTEEPKNLTSILYSSAGLLRIEGWFKITGIDGEVQIIFSIDFANKRLLVGFQLPTFYYPTKDKPTIVFQPGQVFIGTSFGGKPYFLFSLGWPPQTGGSAYERDWSKANKAVWSPPNPPLPNMVAAGAMYELDHKNGYMLFAAALKAGWQIDLNFGIGKAGLEISLGGVLVIKFQYSSASYELHQTTVKNLITQKYLNSTIINSLPGISKKKSNKIYDSIYSDYLSVRHDLDSSRDLNVAILGEIFSDIKGYATVGIFGVTLAGIYLHAYSRMRVCGSTDSGITHVGGSFGAKFCVKIGCTTYCKSAEISVILVSGPCEAAPRNYQFLS